MNDGVWTRRLRLILLACGVLLISWRVISESRRSPLDVAESRSAIEQPYQVLYQAGFDRVRLYLLKTPDEYKTVWCNRDLWGWRGFAIKSVPRTDPESILTASYDHFSLDDDPGVTFLAVEVSDTSVSFIEAGPPDDRAKREVPEDGMVFFLWQGRRLQDYELAPLALSAIGETLYQYEQRPVNGAITFPGSLKWWEPENAAC